MAGTKEGARKRRETMIKKAGGLKKYLQQQRQLAAKAGAKAPGHFKKDRKLASKAGTKSKRGKMEEINYKHPSLKMGRQIAKDIEAGDRHLKKKGINLDKLTDEELAGL